MKTDFWGCINNNIGEKTMGHHVTMITKPTASCQYLSNELVAARQMSVDLFCTIELHKNGNG